MVESPEIARYVRERTTDDDRIAVIGSEPQIYFYTGRRPATRYLYTYPLMEPHPYAREMQLELCREVDAAMAGCVLVDRLVERGDDRSIDGSEPARGCLVVGRHRAPRDTRRPEQGCDQESCDTSRRWRVTAHATR
jgi:hypothetical protein